MKFINLTEFYFLYFYFVLDLVMLLHNSEHEKSYQIKSDSLLLRAIDGVRTRDPDLGKVVLYQLSHYRISYFVCPARNNIYITTSIL